MFSGRPAHMPQDAAKFTADQLAYFRGLALRKFTTFIPTTHPHPRPRERKKDCVKCTDKSRALWFCCNKAGRHFPSMACSSATHSRVTGKHGAMRSTKTFGSSCLWMQNLFLRKYTDEMRGSSIRGTSHPLISFPNQTQANWPSSHLEDRACARPFPLRSG